jgi:glycosyltransferase involved in cell wall biosynthesis
MPRRVLFVSKPIAPPFHDGTKCLVRDVARALTAVQPIVMTTRGAPAIAGVEQARVYVAPGRFAPSAAANLRAATWLLARSRADLWHFVFAPNPRTSRAGRVIAGLRRMPVVQTVASPPRSFDAIDRLLFGDVVVAQSGWTRDRIRERAPARRVELIPPPLAVPEPRTPEAIAAARRALDIAPGVPILIYPGDLETSSGARAVKDLVAPLARQHGDAVVVFAYRAKTPRAELLAAELARELDPRRVRIKGDVADVLALIQASSAVLFPVDDLWGKVDLPIVLLEAMALGVPVVAYDFGPLAELKGVLHVPTGDQRALFRATNATLADAGLRERVIAEQRETVLSCHDQKRVAGAYERLYLELLDHAP